MALPLHALRIIKPYLGGNVLSLGYPDLEVRPHEVEQLFGYSPRKFTEAHIWHRQTNPFPDTDELFAHTGGRLTVVDYVSDRGMEVIADLNHPHDLGKFDLVIDPGTLEHCFNIGQGFLNACNAVKVGGRIFHLNPMNMLNHGFYNLNPTLYHDFYIQNGWKLEDFAVLPAYDVPVMATKRFLPQQEFLMRVTAKRLTDEPLIFPIQEKYRQKLKERA